jgi:SAM-dependent methyltransferase
MGFAYAHGIDISRPSVEYANRKMGRTVAIAADFLSQPFMAGEFDMVTLWATLEHVAEPERFLRECCRVLKKGGMVCLSVPNRSGVSMRGLGPRWRMVGLEHLNYFTPASLRLLLERVGFVTRETQTRSFDPLSFWRDLGRRHLSGQFGQRELLAEYQSSVSLRRNPAIRLAQRLVDVAVTWLGVGDLLILTAQEM